jgi:hypothetical protein
LTGSSFCNDARPREMEIRMILSGFQRWIFCQDYGRNPSAQVLRISILSLTGESWRCLRVPIAFAIVVVSQLPGIGRCVALFGQSQLLEKESEKGLTAHWSAFGVVRFAQYGPGLKQLQSLLVCSVHAVVPGYIFTRP